MFTIAPQFTLNFLLTFALLYTSYTHLYLRPLSAPPITACLQDLVGGADSGQEVGGAPTIIVIPVIEEVEVQGACRMSSDGQSAPERSLSVPLTMDRGLPPSEFPPVLVMYHPYMEALARSLVKTVNDHNLNGKDLKYRRVELFDGIDWQHFRDGWPNIFIQNVKMIAGRDVILFASFHSPELVFEQLSLIYSLPRYLVRSFRLILPFFPTATMERIDKEGQIVTAKSMATMLSNIPLAGRGPAQIFIFDIHALQERFYFSDVVIPRLLSAIPLLIRELKNLSDVTVAFPDEGAWKRFHTDLSQWPTITCIKIREGDKRVVTIKDGEPSERHVVIVDDLVQTGGTLLECAKALHARGAARISLYVTHAVFPQESWRKFIECKEVEFANFWITDSLPSARDLDGKGPFRVISICDVIADSLLGYDLLNCNQ